MALISKTFRVFVSSTFSDLKEERNALQKNVFPQLRALCRKHGCRFQAIDLRWGVREEATLDHKTMKICLDEIERCQITTPKPNFIVLLGDRYGWVPLPAEIPSREIKQILKGNLKSGDKELLMKWYTIDLNANPPVYCLQPRKVKIKESMPEEDNAEARKEEAKNWESTEQKLRKILQSAIDKINLSKDEKSKYSDSATEQEITAGTKVPNAREHVFCFFRNFEGLPNPKEKNANYFIDLDENKKLDSDAHKRLECLKRRLRDFLPHNYYDYPAEWKKGDTTTNHIKKLCEDVYDSLSRIIQKEIEKLTEIDSVEAEIAAHDAFGKEKARFFTSREGTLKCISGYLKEGNSHPLAVVGLTGSGKSALIATSAERSNKDYPQAVFITRYIDATPDSSNIRALLNGICRQIYRDYGKNESSVPADYKELLKEFPESLDFATHERPLFLFLDGLDQLSDAENARTLTWLPSDLPDAVRIVVTTAPNNCSSILEKKFPKENAHKLKKMPLEDGEKLLDLWLDNEKRTLQDEQRREILDKFSQCGLPLFLKLAFNEAKQWKSYDPPSKLSKDIQGLIGDLFTRLSSEANHGEAFFSRILGYLSAAKNGLSEDELLEVISRDVKAYTAFLRSSYHLPPDLLAWLKENISDSDLRQLFGLDRKKLEEDPPTLIQTLLQDKEKLEGFLSTILAEPNGPRLPVVLWSRLYFDLEFFLTERQLEGTSLIAFSHPQIGKIAKDIYLKDGDKINRHKHLAEYFEERLSQPYPHALKEITFQLSHSHQSEKLINLLTNINYLDDRCNLADAYDLLNDFGLLKDTASDILSLYQEFIQKHAQRLARYKNLLFTLINHEGFSKAKAQAQALIRDKQWKKPWIQITPAWMPPTRVEKKAKESIELLSKFVFEASPASSLIKERELGIYLKSIGSLRLVDMNNGSELPQVILNRRLRPLKISCSDKGNYIVIAYENSEADLLFLDYDKSGNLINSNTIETFEYLLPEYEDPVLEFVGDELFYQNNQREVLTLKIDSGQETSSEVLLESVKHGAELSGVIHLPGINIITLREGNDTSITMRKGPESSSITVPDTDVSSYCMLGKKRFALAFSNRKITVYKTQDNLEQIIETEVEEIPVCMVNTGDLLIWVSEIGTFHTWDLEHPDKRPESIKKGPDFIKASRMLVNQEGSVDLITFSTATRFKISRKTPEDKHDIIHLFTTGDKGKYYAIDRRDDDWWLLDGVSRSEEFIAEKEILPEFALDSTGHLFYEKSGQVFIMDLSTKNSKAVPGAPIDITSVSMHPSCGFWISARSGSLYFVAPEGTCQKVTTLDHVILENPSVSCWNNLLLWTASCQKYIPGSGEESRFVQAFFLPSVRNGDANLESIGQRDYDLTEGSLNAFTFDDESNQFYVFFTLFDKNRVKKGTLKDFINFQEINMELDGITEVPQAAALSPDGKKCYLLVSSGDLFILDTNRFNIQAIISGSERILRIAQACTPDAPLAFVEGGSRIFFFDFQETKKSV